MAKRSKDLRDEMAAIYDTGNNSDLPLSMLATVAEDLDTLACAVASGTMPDRPYFFIQRCRRKIEFAVGMLESEAGERRAEEYARAKAGEGDHG